MAIPNPQKHALSSFYLSGYLQKIADHDNFPQEKGEDVFDRYELVFFEALKVLGISKQSLRSKPEFNFDSDDVCNLEAGIAILRTVNALHLLGHKKISLITPPKHGAGADITSEKAGKKICFEVKALTKQSTGGDAQVLRRTTLRQNL